MKRKFLALLVSLVMVATLLTPITGTLAEEVQETPAPTEVPATEVPATDVPATEVPATDVPATDVPATDVPATDVPATDVPATDVPATDVPATDVPATDVPATDVPATDVPATDVPATDVPATDVPATDVPATDVPATDVPATDVPATDVPATDVPATDAPTAEPTVEPTAEPTAEPTLEIGLSLSSGYAMANRDSISLNVTVAGGTAPYTVAFYVMKGSEVLAASTSEQGESFTLNYAPTTWGEQTLSVTVSDANGLTGSASVAMEAAMNETENESDWQRMADAIELTGDWREDLLAFADTQVGYRANEKNFIYNEEGVRSLYTRYGDWYGLEYSEWCAMFVSFCLHYVEAEDEAVFYNHSCSNWKDELEYVGAYVKVTNEYDVADDYEPQAGDLVFFNWEDEDEPQHVGIVEKVGEDGIETIEGNSGNAVVRKSHRFEDGQIVGYVNLGVLQERAEMLERAKTEEPVGALWNVAGITARTNTDRVNLRSAANTDCEVVAMLKAAGTKVEVLGAADVDGTVWYEVEYEGKNGYIRYDLVLLDTIPAATEEPTAEPTEEPTAELTEEPTVEPTEEPTEEPTAEPTEEPTAEPTVEPTIEPMIELVQPTALAMEQAEESGAEVTLTYGVSDANAAYQWQRSALNGEWENIEGATEPTLTLTGDAANAKYEYRCLATRRIVNEDGAETDEIVFSEVVTLVREELVAWMNEAEVTDEMLKRAMGASSVDSMVVEEDALVYIRTGEVYARIDQATGCMIDEASGLVVAIVDMENGLIYPISNETADEA